MLITAREACFVLRCEHVSRRCALQVLGSGLAGKGYDGGTVVLYDEARVRDLAERGVVTWAEADQLSPRGFFVSRRAFPVESSWESRAAGLSGGWSGPGAMSPWSWVAMSLMITKRGRLPFVATIGGLVVFGADVVAMREGKLVLERPGPWFDVMDGRWFPTGRGRPWVLRLGPLRPEKIAG